MSIKIGSFAGEICFLFLAIFAVSQDSAGLQAFHGIKLHIDFCYVLILFTQSNLGKKRSELKHLIKERAKKLDEIKQSIKVIKVSHLVLVPSVDLVKECVLLQVKKARQSSK